MAEKAKSVRNETQEVEEVKYQTRNQKSSQQEINQNRKKTAIADKIILLNKVLTGTYMEIANNFTAKEKELVKKFKLLTSRQQESELEKLKQQLYSLE